MQIWSLKNPKTWKMKNLLVRLCPCLCIIGRRVTARVRCWKSVGKVCTHWRFPLSNAAPPSSEPLTLVLLRGSRCWCIIAVPGLVIFWTIAAPVIMSVRCLRWMVNFGYRSDSFCSALAENQTSANPQILGMFNKSESDGSFISSP